MPSELYHHGYLTVPDKDGDEVHYILPITTTKDIIVDAAGTKLDVYLINVWNAINSIAAGGVPSIPNEIIDQMFAGTYT